MKIRCSHGYFTFEETQRGQVSDFMSLTGLLLAPLGDLYTFEDLALAPDFSIEGLAYLSFVANKTFEGSPGEIFEANAVIYNPETGLIVPIASITKVTKVETAGNRMISPGLILPGSVTQDGERVKDYSAWYSRDTGRYSYSEVTFV